MTEAKQAKEKVLAVHAKPSITHCAHVWEVWESEAFEGNYAHRLGHSSKSKSSAWLNAASHLPAREEPAKPLPPNPFNPFALDRQDVWKPVSEGLPEHGGPVLVTWQFIGNDSGPFVSVARYEKGHWDWNSKTANDNRCDEEVQAWMDQPSPYRACAPSPIPSATGDPFDYSDWHLVLSKVQNTDHAKGKIEHALLHLTDDQRRSLFRAVARLSRTIVPIPNATELIAKSRETNEFWEIQDLRMDGEYHRSNVSLSYESEADGRTAIEKHADSTIHQRLVKITIVTTRKELICEVSL